MTSTHIHAVFFGGPQDGAIFPLSAEDIARGHVDAEIGRASCRERV